MMTSLTTFPKNTLQQSNLLGRLILNHETTEEIGHVKEFWLDPTLHQVTAIVSESGLLGRTKQFLRWEQVEAIGEDSLLVSLALDTSEETPQGSELVIGHELWTNDGNKAGTITDYCFDLANRGGRGLPVSLERLAGHHRWRLPVAARGRAQYWH
jgi:uncharacterized protein YrrD